MRKPPQAAIVWRQVISPCCLHLFHAYRHQTLRLLGGDQPPFGAISLPASVESIFLTTKIFVAGFQALSFGLLFVSVLAHESANVIQSSMKCSQVPVKVEKTCYNIRGWM
eukprot:GHVS01075611.1.p1 GENE.GHVS01075611.1~~GHVS01075611.1.p1  ORF type:complete len:110 (-),score=2.46 GHVS01075611.1:247-576(-)